MSSNKERFSHKIAPEEEKEISDIFCFTAHVWVILRENFHKKLSSLKVLSGCCIEGGENVKNTNTASIKKESRERSIFIKVPILYEFYAKNTMSFSFIFNTINGISIDNFIF